MALTFSKFFYLASLTNYYTFFLIGKFHVSVESAQVHLFVFLAAVATGGLVGGPLGDRIGRKYIIWGSILGVLPFTLVLPYANLYWTGVLSVIDRAGAGLGLRGDSGIRAGFGRPARSAPSRACFTDWRSAWAASARPCLGTLADLTSIDFIYRVCAFLPAIGLLAVFLPEISPAEARGVDEG